MRNHNKRISIASASLLTSLSACESPSNRCQVNLASEAFIQSDERAYTEAAKPDGSDIDLAVDFTTGTTSISNLEPVAGEGKDTICKGKFSRTVRNIRYVYRDVGGVAVSEFSAQALGDESDRKEFEDQLVSKLKTYSYFDHVMNEPVFSYSTDSFEVSIDVAWTTEYEIRWRVQETLAGTQNIEIIEVGSAEEKRSDGSR